LVYLRARYYAPQDGRFLSRDTWGGDYERPLSLNRWNYVEGNPVNYADSTGHIKQGKESETAWKYVNELKVYDIHVQVDWGEHNPFLYLSLEPQDGDLYQCGWVEGKWALDELYEVRKGVVDLARSMGGLNKFLRNIHHLDVKKRYTEYKALFLPGSITVTNRHNNLSRTTIVHELAHAWDYSYGNNLSAGMELFTGGHTGGVHDSSIPYNPCTQDSRAPGCNDAHYFYGGIPAYVSSSSHFNRKEDFAYSVSAYVYPNKFYAEYITTKYQEDYPGLIYTDFRNSRRWLFIHAWIQANQ